MDGTYDKLKTTISVHPAFVPKENSTKSTTDVDQPILHSHGIKFTYQNQLQGLFLQRTGETYLQNQNDEITYSLYCQGESPMTELSNKRGITNHKHDVINKMPYHKNNIRVAGYQDFGANRIQHVQVIVPSLDLTSLTMEDETDIGSNEVTKNAQKEENTGGDVLFRKQRMPFVFPSEKSFTDIDVIRGNPSHTQYEDPYCITSVSSYRTSSLVNEPATGKESEMAFDDGTISFSLSNPKYGKYILEGDAPKADTKEHVECNFEMLRTTKSTAFSSGCKPTATAILDHGATENTMNPEQQVYDVIVVNGHLHDENRDDPQEDVRSHIEARAEGEMLKEKPKTRVTFSFADTGTPRGRYTPIKGDVRIQLQSVLKKRKTPSPVLHRSSSEERVGGRKKHIPIVNKESIRLFGSSYTLDYRFGYHTYGMEHGIPVKNVHSTSTDLEKRQAKTMATNIVEKPPVPSANRITLSMAEKAAMSGSVRGMPSRGAHLSTSQMRGRMAFFRPADKSRSPTNQNSRSRSSDDIHSMQNRSNVQSNSTTNKGLKNQTTLPFSLRRCASSEHDLRTVDSNTHSRRKPKVAFGSFILPKETSTRGKPAQVQFHELNSTNGIPLGTYVHTHTRRSPYAAPTQVLLTENRKSEVIRRPGTSSAQTRQLQQPQHQQGSFSNKNHAQRHSAPSAFSHIRETSLPVSHPERISINTSPTKAHFPKSTIPTNETSSSNRTTTHHQTSSHKVGRFDGSHSGHNTGVNSLKTGSNADFATRRKANIAELNSMANKERGASHHRFVAKLQSYTKEGL